MNPAPEPLTPAQLRAWLAARGWSPQDLADKLGRDRVTVWRWTTGRRAMPPDIRLTLAALDTEQR